MQKIADIEAEVGVCARGAARARISHVCCVSGCGVVRPCTDGQDPEEQGVCASPLRLCGGGLHSVAACAQATMGHLGKLKARLAKLKEEIINPRGAGGGGKGEGFDVTKSGDARVGLIGERAHACTPLPRRTDMVPPSVSVPAPQASPPWANRRC